MNKKIFLLIVSVFEIIRWITIYFFLNYTKSFMGSDPRISGENFLWFGSAFFANALFAFSGVTAFINPAKYLIVTKFWALFKFVFLVFVIFLLFYGLTSLRTYFLIFAPFDFFIFLFLLFYGNASSSRKDVA
ncbi:MAG TPA: hypothetical protein PLO89_11705 [Spirochaetota bacterium]|nr:hypothetical protein [Spirochaetota bacterium]